MKIDLFCPKSFQSPTLKSECIFQWSSNEDLLECLLASSFLPTLSSMGRFTKKWGNQYYPSEKFFDGGINFKHWQPIPVLYKTLTKINPYILKQDYPLDWPLDQWINILNNLDWYHHNFKRGYQEASKLHEQDYREQIL